MRNTGNVGKFNEPGLPNFIGACHIGFPEGQQGTFGHTGAVAAVGHIVGMYGGGSISDHSAGHEGGIQIDPSLVSDIYGAVDTVMPASADMAVGIYLGRPAEV